MLELYNINFQIFSEYVLSPFLIHNLIFWGMSFFFFFYEILMDILNITTTFRKRERNPVSYLNLFGYIVLNMCMTFIFLFLIIPYTAKLPIYEENLIQKFFLCFIYEEMFFYGFHSLLHTEYLYKFHKTHHLWKNPISFTALYSHPLEHILTNILPVFLSAYLTGLSWYWMKIWLYLATANAVIAHSGIATVFHANHHYFFNVNYGVLGILDKFFDTYKEENF